MKKLKINGKAEPVELKLTPSGRWVQISFSTLSENNLTLLIAEDITERKIEEIKLHEEKQKLESITEGVNESILLVSPDYRILWANKVAVERTGYKLEDMIGNYCYKITHGRDTPCDSPLDPCPIRLIEAGGRPASVPHIHLKRNGSKIFTEVVAYPLKDEFGSVTGYVHICRDITEEKKTKEALERLTATLTTTIEHLPEGILLLDTENKITLMNSTAKSYFESSFKEGDKLDKIFGVSVEKILTFPGAPVRWMDIKTKAGKIFEVAGRPVGDKGEVGKVIVIKDVTEERRHEEAVRTQERLASVGQLAAGIAHDFNNILNVILGISELILLDRKTPAELRDRINIIKNQVDRAARLIRQILDFSRKSLSQKQILDLLPFLKELLRCFHKRYRKI